MEHVNWDFCNASILGATKIECGGLCMLCFKKENKGLSPSQLASIKDRGLSDIFDKWNKLVRQGVPNIRNPVVSQKFHQSVPIVYSSVNGCFRSKNTKFDKNSILNLLTELKALGNKELEVYIGKVEAFILELIRATKS